MTGSSNTILQARDIELLKAFEWALIIDREQAKAISGFKTTQAANRRLLKLHRAGLLARVFIGSANGGQKALYFLTSKGAEIAGVPYRRLKRTQDVGLVIDPFIEHQLALNRVLIAACYDRPPIDNLRCRHWRTFQGPVAEANPITPDAYFEVESPQGIYAMFVEVDRRTEILKSWKKKAEGYLHLARSGEFERVFGLPRFRVLVVAPTDLRLKSIRKAVLGVTDKLFFFTTFEFINREGFWSAIWERPIDGQKQSLV